MPKQHGCGDPAEHPESGQQVRCGDTYTDASKTVRVVLCPYCYNPRSK